MYVLNMYKWSIYDPMPCIYFPSIYEHEIIIQRKSKASSVWGRFATLKCFHKVMPVNGFLKKKLVLVILKFSRIYFHNKDIKYITFYKYEFFPHATSCNIRVRSWIFINAVWELWSFFKTKNREVENSGKQY